MADNSAFISYRRGDGYPWARLIWEELQNRSINAFLDLESMRQAGRFDTRILNQISARPYFLMVLAEGSLDRCVSESDWVRREIEHAIDTSRIVVPLFIAPFDPSQFPRELPDRIRETLANSNGVTFYSQFLAAALDQLADFLVPVAVATEALSDDDAEFEQQAISQVRAMPAPIVPNTPPTSEPGAPPPPPSPPIDVPPIRTEADGSGQIPVVDPNAGRVTESDASAAAPVAPYAQAEVGMPPDAPTSGATPPEPTPPEPTPPEPTPPPVVVPVGPSGSRRKKFMVASVVAVALVLGTIVALTVLGGDGETDDTVPESAADDEVTDDDSSDDGSSDDDSSDDGSSDDDGEDVATTTVAVDEPTILIADTNLGPGDAIFGDDGRLELTMTPSGRLILTDHLTGDEWEPEYTSERVAGGIARFQSNYHLVLYRTPDDLTESNSYGAIGRAGPPGQSDSGATLRLARDEHGGYIEALDNDGHREWRRPEAPTPPTTVPADTTTTSSTTIPSTADIELRTIEQVVDELHFTFVNHGTAEASIDEVIVELISRFQEFDSTPGAGSAVDNYVNAGDLQFGVPCRFTPVWAPIPPTALEEVRTIRFGRSLSSESVGRAVDVRVNAVGPDLRDADALVRRVTVSDVVSSAALDAMSCSSEVRMSSTTTVPPPMSTAP